MKQKPIWSLYIVDNFVVETTNPPNWFQRRMQAWLLGFKWVRHGTKEQQ